MGEEQVSIEELARKIDELLSVLNVISGDLAEVSKSLKSVSKPVAAPIVSVAPATKTQNIDSVKQAFSSEGYTPVTYACRSQDLSRFRKIRDKRR